MIIRSRDLGEITRSLAFSCTSNLSSVSPLGAVVSEHVFADPVGCTFGHRLLRYLACKYSFVTNFSAIF